MPFKVIKITFENEGCEWEYQSDRHTLSYMTSLRIEAIKYAFGFNVLNYLLCGN